jgi:hypothetical protein
VNPGQKIDARTVALRAAVAEAERFLKRAREALADDTPTLWPSIQRAAARRASMDLTRALARWRQTP